MTRENFNDLVYGSGNIWVIQLYDPTDEDCEKVNPIWQSVAKEWRKYVRFGRINYREDPRTMNMLPFKWQVFPTIATYTPVTGEFDVLPFKISFDKKWLSEEIAHLLSQGVERVNTGSARSFLKMGKSFRVQNDVLLTTFNFLLLKKQYETPREFTKAAIANAKRINFGAAEPHDSAAILEKLKLKPEGGNVVVSYRGYSEKGSRKSVLRTTFAQTTAEIEAAVDIAKRHTIVGIFSFENLTS